MVATHKPALVGGGLFVIFLIALMALTPVVSAAITVETGTVISTAPDKVRADVNGIVYPVDGGIPVACNSVGSFVTFDIDLADIEPRASGVACVTVAPPPSDVDNDGDNNDDDDGQHPDGDGENFQHGEDGHVCSDDCLSNEDDGNNGDEDDDDESGDDD